MNTQQLNGEYYAICFLKVVLRPVFCLFSRRIPINFQNFKLIRKACLFQADIGRPNVGIFTAFVVL